MNSLLTQQLEASINYERIKMRIKQLERAQKYLIIAQEASRRLSNRIKMVELYDEARANFEPWTLILTKEEAIKKAKDTQDAYCKLMRSYRMILENQL